MAAPLLLYGVRESTASSEWRSRKIILLTQPIRSKRLQSGDSDSHRYDNGGRRDATMVVYR